MAGPGRLLLAVVVLLAVDAARGDPVTVVDADGRTVALAAPARRIVSLSPHLTEQLFAIGAGAQIVATVEWSDYPAGAREIPRVGSSSAVNDEVLLRQDPDLVVLWRSGNGAQLASRLRALGLTVYVQEPRSIEDIPRELIKLGVLTGHRQDAKAAARRFTDKITALRDNYESRAPVRVFQQIWNQPMITLNGEHLMSDVIRLCGGHNIFADAPALVVNTSREMVLIRDPEVIVISEADGAPPAWLGEWRQWPGISAVANGQIHVIDPDLLHRHGPRIAEGAALMCDYIDRARQARSTEPGAPAPRTEPQ